jgi:hypothetical protein
MIISAPAIIPAFRQRLPSHCLETAHMSQYNNFFPMIVSLRTNRILGTAIGYGLDDRGVGVRVPEGSRIVLSARRPDQLRGQPCILSNG